MSAIREAQRQIFEQKVQTTDARRHEQPAPARIEQIERPSEGAVTLSSRASEIIASDRLQNFWNSTISTPKAADPAAPVSLGNQTAAGGLRPDQAGQP